MAESEQVKKVPEKKEKKLPRGLYLRGDVYWIRYSNGQGKTIRESTFSTDKKKAENLLTIRRNDVLHGRLPEIHSTDKGRTFADLAKYYKENVSVKKASQYTETCNINIMTNDMIGHVKLHKLSKNTAELIQEYVRKERGGSDATANRYVAIFKNMVRVAYEEKWVNMSVLEDVRRVKMYSEVAPDIKPLSPKECVEIIKKAPSHIRNALVLGIFTGLRRFDVLNLKWENVNFDTGVISLIINKTRNTKKVVETHHIQMGATLRMFLENTERCGEYIVSKPGGGKFKTIKESWDKARVAIGKPHLRLHDLRHTFASILAQNGTDIYTISHILGHSSVQMSRRYAHLNPEHHSKETRKLDGIIEFSPQDMLDMQENAIVTGEDMELKIQKKYRKIDTDFGA